MNQTIKTKKIIKDEKHVNLKNPLISALIITFFVGVVLLYYNMFYD